MKKRASRRPNKDEPDTENEPPEKMQKTSDLINEIAADREKTAKSVLEFKFNKKRINIITTVDEVAEDSSGILYWMSRDARVQDNWAFLFAQKIALKNSLPLHVCYCIPPTFLEASIRHYKFMLKNLQQVEAECKTLNINFHLLKGEPEIVVYDFIVENNFGALIVDFSPLKPPKFWLECLREKLPKTIPIAQIDAHNVVPCWLASDKLEYSARTIRPKINSKLPEFLTRFPPLIKHPHTAKKQLEEIDWEHALDHVEVDKTVSEIDWAVPGYEAGIEVLEIFMKKHLQYHATIPVRNNPVKDVSSNLSPWFHFGMISVQRCVLTMQKYEDKYKKPVEIFMENAIVRKELSDNFCYYNENYDCFEGANQWGIDTLNEHRGDKRKPVYKLEQFEHAKTYDDLWNSAQLQLTKQGKIHQFLRMYWAKKFLEWSPTPEDALEWSIYLNNKYSIDGCDPNGYVGCMWSVCGLHDQAFAEREIFGKVRYMNYEGCERKFDVPAFVKKWGGKEF